METDWDKLSQNIGASIEAKRQHKLNLERKYNTMASKTMEANGATAFVEEDDYVLEDTFEAGGETFDNPDDEGVGVDLSDMVDEIIPDGEYHAIVTGFKSERNRAEPDIKQWVVDFRVSTGPYAGFKQTKWYKLSKKAVVFAAQFVEALGVGKRGEKVNFLPADVIGKPCRIKLKFQKGTGDYSDGMSIAKVLPPNQDSMAAAMDVEIMEDEE